MERKRKDKNGRKNYIKNSFCNDFTKKMLYRFKCIERLCEGRRGMEEGGRRANCLVEGVSGIQHIFNKNWRKMLNIVQWPRLCKKCYWIFNKTTERKYWKYFLFEILFVKYCLYLQNIINLVPWSFYTHLFQAGFHFLTLHSSIFININLCLQISRIGSCYKITYVDMFWNFSQSNIVGTTETDVFWNVGSWR